MVAIATFPSADVRYAGFDLVHPLAVKAFRSLEADLIAASVIETFPSCLSRSRPTGRRSVSG